LPAPDSGTIGEVLKQKGDVAKVGEVIGYLEQDGQGAATTKAPPKKAPEKTPEAKPEKGRDAKTA